MMVQSSAAGGVLERDEQELLINVFDFGSRAAYQVMVPRTEVATIEDSAMTREFLELFRTTGHTRFPVLGERGVDDVRGIISAKDLLVALGDGSIGFDQPITPLIRPAFFTPDSKRISDLLHAMQREHVRMAVLVDEYGGMAGIATLEDLVEEIVGEMDDELDTTPADMETVDEHTTIVEGLTRIEAANDELRLTLPEGEYETVAGLILDRLGRLPQPGEQVQLDGVVLTVLELQGPRIARIQIKRR
jgi:putative hemolysin